MKNKIMAIILLVTINAQASNLQDQVIATKHNTNLTLKEIAQIQPGLGTIMIEFGHRFHIVYYAAKAKNWDLAEYELHELVEASEVAEVTRVKYKKDLKDFEDSYIKSLKESIKEKDWDKFSQNYTNTVKGCNICHSKTGHPYIKYQLPSTPPLTLKMAL